MIPQKQKDTMAAQAPKAPESRETKRGIKNPFIYAGTIVVLVIVGFVLGDRK